MSLLAVLMLAALGGACSPRYVRSAPLPASLKPPAIGISQNVVVVSVDGLRPDAIERFGAPTMTRLMREGSYTLSAQTIDPSKTLPSHTSMLTGLPPEQHHVLWNNVASAKTDEIGLPNIFGVARSHGFTTAAFFSKAKFQPLQLEGTLDYSQAPGGLWGRWSSDRTVTDVARYLEDAKPNVLFVHLTDPDAAGHRNGWMTPEYGRAVLAADTAIDRLIDVAERVYGAGKFSLIVTADHGGHGTGHGSNDPQDVTIPWIAWGQGVKAGVLDANAVIHTMDTASTVLWMLGVPEPDAWTGDAVVRAFNPRPALLAQTGAAGTTTGEE